MRLLDRPADNAASTSKEITEAARGTGLTLLSSVIGRRVEKENVQIDGAGPVRVETDAFAVGTGTGQGLGPEHVARSAASGRGRVDGSCSGQVLGRPIQSDHQDLPDCHRESNRSARRCQWTQTCARPRPCRRRPRSHLGMVPNHGTLCRCSCGSLCSAVCPNSHSSSPGRGS